MEVFNAAGVRLAPAVEPYRAQLAAARVALGSALRHLPGVLVEDKGATVAIHYRQTASPSAARREILRLVGQHAGGLRSVEGKMVVELRPPVAITKGTALRRLVVDYALRGVVYLGDDRTDVDALAEVRRLRAMAPTVATLGLAVGGAETPSEVLAAADLVVDGIEQVEEVLSGLVVELAGSSY